MLRVAKAENPSITMGGADISAYHSPILKSPAHDLQQEGSRGDVFGTCKHVLPPDLIFKCTMH